MCYKKSIFCENFFSNMFGFVVFKMRSELEAKVKGGIVDCDRRVSGGIDLERQVKFCTVRQYYWKLWCYLDIDEV